MLKNKVEIGIDLAGVDTKPTGFAVLNGMEATTTVLYSDSEIIGQVTKFQSSIVSIDAPLSMPVYGKSRLCEKELRKMGIRVFPCLFAGMRKLTERGIRLAKELRELNFNVIESYPGSAQDILNIPRKSRGIKPLQQALWKYGVRGDFLRDNITDHELDAITSAIVGKLYLAGKTISIGNKTEGFMIIPKKPSQSLL